MGRTGFNHEALQDATHACLQQDPDPKLDSGAMCMGGMHLWGWHRMGMAMDMVPYEGMFVMFKVGSAWSLPRGGGGELRKGCGEHADPTYCHVHNSWQGILELA